MYVLLQHVNKQVQLDEIDLQLEAEPMTDVEESLPR